jgi:hypothetical protein
MSAIWESANWTRQFGIRQTGNRHFGMLPVMDMNRIPSDRAGHYLSPLGPSTTLDGFIVFIKMS